ncbi:MAG: PVC-type heme-binding CxxCH protein [Planctomycetota bacterium]
MIQQLLCNLPVALATLFLSGAIGFVNGAHAQEEFIPRRQSKPPGPPLSPAEALAKMQVPEGFRVELVASEPDILNPVAMAYDDAGRIYVTESFEYPRQEAGPGRDRIKILEDTDRDGRVDRVKIFAEGLNIPSGIAVGHGGVWVANAPDILFLEDTNGDDVADKSTVIVTGFGRDDTHELPNALTWGPDGYLYGLNGVFNRSVVKQFGREFDFTCALFRIHPRTKKFELFCQGTSNPWGVAFDSEGSAFVSACVIDHLWHLTESAYYLRQGGPYPPHTWWAESIVKHKHQMAAYCGIEYFDSAAYPPAYRDKLYMGNIHGGCINVDRIQRSGATYQGFGEPDFLTSNDVWFMPVAQKVGPDGCLYVLDWYDRYHCYQDAKADPQGIDRGHGRLYRIVHEKRPEVRYPDISRLDGPVLVQAIGDDNVFVRQRAQLELAERGATKDPKLADALEKIVFSEAAMKTRMHSLWAMAGAGTLPSSLLTRLLSDTNPELRAWGVRLAGDHQPEDAALAKRIRTLASDADPRVRLQVAIAAPKLERNVADAGRIALATELDVLTHSGDDPILPRVVWQNMLPWIDRYPDMIQQALRDGVSRDGDLLRGMLARIAAKWASTLPTDVAQGDGKDRLVSMLQLADAMLEKHPDGAAVVVYPIVYRILNGEISMASGQSVLHPWLDQLRVHGAFVMDNPAWRQASLLARLICNESGAQTDATQRILDRAIPAELRRETLMFAAVHPNRSHRLALEQVLGDLVEGKQVGPPFRDMALDLGIARADDEAIEILVHALPQLPSDVQAGIAERMCLREPGTTAFLQQVAAGHVRKELLGPNRVRLLATEGSDSAKGLIAKVWGTVSTATSQEREDVVRRVADQLRWDARGNAEKGWVVYNRICGQCHVMHNQGAEVGPNITANGRGSYEQLLVSIFHPSLVIGDAYRSVTLRTEDGAIVTGLLVSRDDAKTVIKVQGGKETTIPAAEIAEFRQDTKSLMPEGLENQMTPQEMADLFALLTLEKPPGTPDNGTISGTPLYLHQPR